MVCFISLKPNSIINIIRNAFLVSHSISRLFFSNLLVNIVYLNRELLATSKFLIKYILVSVTFLHIDYIFITLCQSTRLFQREHVSHIILYVVS